MSNRFLSTLATAVLLMLCSCLQRPEAGEFTTPELGDVIIKVDESDRKNADGKYYLADYDAGMNYSVKDNLSDGGIKSASGKIWGK